MMTDMKSIKYVKVSKCAVLWIPSNTQTIKITAQSTAKRWPSVRVIHQVQTESVHCDKVQTNHNTAELQDKQHNIIDRASVYSGRGRSTQNASRTYIRETVLILQCSSWPKHAKVSIKSRTTGTTLMVTKQLPHPNKYINYITIERNSP